MFRFLFPTDQNLKLFYFIGLHDSKKTITRKKNPEIVKEKLLNFLRQSDTVKEREFNIQNINDQRNAIDIIIKRYEEIIKTGNKK